MSKNKLHSNDKVTILEKKNEFIKLFQEFISSYPYTQAGLRHQKVYHEERKKGKENFQAIEEAFKSGEDVNEKVLLQLLPYAQTANNSEKNVWIHHAAAITKDIKEWFESAGWKKPEDWSKIAQAIFNFVCCCNNDSTQLAKACKDFSLLACTKGFQTEMLK